MKTLTIRVPVELHEALREESHGSRRSINQIVTDAIYAFQRAAFVPQPADRKEA